jgi:hypothetical protein
MKHFPQEAWIDLVRGTATPEHRAKLESHLQQGCKECSTFVNTWKQVVTVASRESNYRPPENTVRMAKLEFQARHAQDIAVTANLTFDSFAAPLLAGVRSIAAAARQMVYEADDLTVDLRFDRQPGSNEIHLIGQILDKRIPRISFGNACVMLWSEKGLPLVETKTNGFGEFSLQFAEQEHLRISIEVGRTLIRIPLSNLSPKQDVGESSEGTNSGNQH